MEINKQLKDEIWDYCRANNITNIDEFITKCLKQGFTIIKFGSTPFENTEKEKPIKTKKVVPVVPINETETTKTTTAKVKNKNDIYGE